MRIASFRRFSVATALVVLLGVLAPFATMADTIPNDLDATVDGDRETLSLSVGQQATVTYRVIPAGSDGDSGLGCNFAAGNTLTVNIYILEGNVVRSPQSNSAVTTDKTQLVFTDCTTPQTITFTGVGVTGLNPANQNPNFQLFFSCNTLNLNVVNAGDQSSCNSAITQGGPANNQTQGRFNFAPATHWTIVTADGTPPVTTATATTPGPVAYTSGAWTNQNVEVTFDATDAVSGVNRIELTQTVNGVTGSMTSHADPYTLTVSTEGVTSISYQAFDNASNAEAPQTFTVNIDRTAPVTTVSAVTMPAAGTYTEGTWTNQNVAVTFTADVGTGSPFDYFDLTFTTADGSTFWLTDTSNPSTFSVGDEGTWTPQYRAVDTAGNEEAFRTYTVMRDTVAPSVTASTDIIVNATSPSGAVVTYAAPVVTDALTPLGQLVIACTPASGSLFLVGTTTVTCTATDLAGNVGTDTFTVTVVGTGDQLDGLYAMVQDVSISGGASTANSVRRTLLMQVSLAQMLEGSNQDTMACLTLTRLELEIQAQVSRRRISNGDARELWDAIDAIQMSLGCGGQNPT